MSYFRIIIFSLISIFLISCSKKVLEKEKFLFFPPPPDSARVQFLTTVNSSLDLEGKPSKLEEFVAGISPEIAISKPYGIAVSKGRILVVDSKLSSVFDLDFVDKKFKSMSPQGFGSLKKPLSPFIKNDTIYVCDLGRKEIVVFNKDFGYLTTIGKGELEKPADICIYDNNIYVPDIEKHRIYVFSGHDFSLLSSFPDNSISEDAPEFLHSPNHIAIRNEKIYVSDFGEFHIKVFDIDGKFIKTIGSYGKNIGQFARPKGIAVDNDGLIYVVDAAFENVQVFNQTGELLFFIGSSGGKTGNIVLPIRVALDYENVKYFEKYVNPSYNLKYLIYVTNQFGNEKVNVYGFLESK